MLVVLTDSIPCKLLFTLSPVHYSGCADSEREQENFAQTNLAKAHVIQLLKPRLQHALAQACRRAIHVMDPGAGYTQLWMILNRASLAKEILKHVKTQTLE